MPSPVKQPSGDEVEPRFIDFKCPFCGEAIAFPETSVGRVQECPLCFQVVVVPARGVEFGSKIPDTLTTARLKLRKLRIDDQPDLLEFIMDEESYKYLEGYAPKEKDVLNWVDLNQEPHFLDDKAILPFGIELAIGSKLIGFISVCVWDAEERQQGEFDEMIARDYRSQGYGTEAVAGLLDFVFTSLNLDWVRVGIDTRNVAARKMAENAGFKLQTEHRADREVKGGQVSTVWYSTFRTENEERKKNRARV